VGRPICGRGTKSASIKLSASESAPNVAKKMKVLLTGGSGFVGQYLLKHLLACDIDTVVVGRALPENCEPANFKKIDLLDNCNFDDLVADVGATHLLHLAWYAEHTAYWTSPLNLSWMQASVSLVEAFCQAGGKKVVIAGTCAEYDWEYGYCSEELTPLKPNTLYGVAKDATRRLAAAVCSKHQVECAWGRIFLPYGQGEDNRRLLPSLIAVFQGKRAPFGVNANVYRDFLHIEDVATGFIALLQTNATGVFNVCSGHPVQLEDVVLQIAQLYQADPKIILDLSTERPGEPLFLVGNNQKLKLLGWQAQYVFADMRKNLEL
jgi:nucleoside-diphosphate-sugar epimerase